MSEKRVDLRYGHFACSIQGFEDPATTLETILRHLQKAVSESPVLAEAGLLDDETAQAIVDDVHGSLGKGAVTMMPGLVIVWDGEVQGVATDVTADDPDHAARPVSGLETLAVDAEDDPGLAALRAALDAHEQRDGGDTDDDLGTMPDQETAGSGGTIFDDNDIGEPSEEEGDGLVLGDDAEDAARRSSSVLGESEEALFDRSGDDGPDRDLTRDELSADGGTIFDDDMDEPSEPGADRDTQPGTAPEAEPGIAPSGKPSEPDGNIFDDPDTPPAETASTMFDDPVPDDDDIGLPDDFDDDLGSPPDDLEEPKVKRKGSFADFARQFHVAGGTDTEVEEEYEEEEFQVSGVSTADIAKAAKAESVPDLIAAAAASLAIVQGRMSFSRKDVLEEFDRIPGKHPKTAEAKIKGWGRLVRDGRIKATEDDLFSLTMDERDRHRDALSR